MEFKVGDEVTVVRRSGNHWVDPMEEEIGRAFKVKRVRSDGYITLQYLDSGNINGWYWKESDLELLNKDITELSELNVDSFISLFG